MPRKANTEKICLSCEKGFLGRSDQLYCAMSCYVGSPTHVAARRAGIESQIERARLNPKLPPHVGVCAYCHKQYRSRVKGTKFCGMRCYTASDDFQIRIRQQARVINGRKRLAAGGDPNSRPQRACAHCGEMFFLKLSEIKSHKYCSRHCYRLYMADRFDRWIANPQSVALPQAYDAFLTQDLLPCLFDGCDWEGHNLSIHVNFTHGVTAEQFKEMAGFNRRTAVITSAVHQKFSEAKSNPQFLKIWEQNRITNPNTSGQIKASLRLEGREHLAKSIALNKIAIEMPEPCVECGIKVVKLSPWGRKIWCSVKCRNVTYARAARIKMWECVCAHCGLTFQGNKYQDKRKRQGKDVMCSTECRGARNISLTPNHQKHRARTVAA